MLAQLITQLLLELGRVGSDSYNQFLEITASVYVELSPSSVFYWQ